MTCRLERSTVPPFHRSTLVLALGVSLAATACEREDRRLNSQQPAAPTQFIAQVPLQPGPTYVNDTTEGPYDDNAPGTTEGQQLFNQMNCSGCHSNGGGGPMPPPPLMDDE